MSEPLTLSKKILDKRDKIQRGRSMYERQWLVNVAFLYGKQHFVLDKIQSTGNATEDRILWELKTEERKGKTRRTSNYILPLYRSLLSRLLRMKAHISVTSLTNSDRDKSASRVSQVVLEDFWLMANKHNPVLCQKYSGMPLVLAKVFGYALTTGRGYLKPYFNVKTLSTAYLNDQALPGAEIGEVEVKALSPFNVFEDPLGRHFIEQSIMPVEEIKKQYGVDVAMEDLAISDIEQQLMTMLDGIGDEKNQYDGCAKVYEYWEVPSDDYPQGRYVICTAKTVIFDGSIPSEYKSRLPYFNIDYLDIMLAQFPQGMIEQLIQLQEDYNYTLSRICGYKKWFAGKIKVPAGCKLETKYDEDIGQYIIYTPGVGEPHFEAPPPPPAKLWDDLVRIRKDMEDVAGVHDSGMGRLPEQIKSGVAIENLNELDNDQLSPILLKIEQQLSFFSETVLDIMQAKYAERRLIGISGDEEAADVRTFLGADVDGQRRIQVSIGSNMPLSKTERQLLIRSMRSEGYINKDKALELMEFGELSGIYNDLDRQAQKMENMEMTKGVLPQVNEWDYHQAHIEVIEKFMKGEAFRKLQPDLHKVFMVHRGLHQKALLNEMQTAANMQMGNPGGPQGQPVKQATPGQA